MHSRGYTHIVIGAGSAGCVVAARIAENNRLNVLLIEAGPDCDPENSYDQVGVQDARRVPMKGQSRLYADKLDWNITVQLRDGETMIVPQARIMGGGSSINGGTALRSTINDSREWVELGNQAWDFDSVRRAYESLEKDDVRGTHGQHPITRTPPEKAGRIQKAFLKGASAAGFPFTLDLNEIGTEGAGPSPVCRQGNRRISASNTFIDPIRDQPNLTILTDTHVDKVLTKGDRVYGVLLTNGQEEFVTGEVILCAGAIFSPAILQRSGIGPINLLQSRQIHCHKDLPVGENLSDHPCLPIVARPRKGAFKEDDYSLEMQARWSSLLQPDAIDLQMVCFSYLFVETPDHTARPVRARTLAGTATGHVAGIGCNVNKPTSVGTVTITSSDAREYPTVQPNYLQTSHDREVAREVVRRAFSVLTSHHMQAVLGKPLTLTQQIVEDDKMLDKWIVSQFSTTYHFCGSCRMASQEKGGVVDQSGKVYGFHGLRVADASVIPTVPACNTMWPTMMFAHRIGCSIRDEIPVEHSAMITPSLAKL